MAALPPASTFPSLPPTTQTTILNTFFEKCPTLTTHLLPILTSTPHESYSSLIEHVRDELHKLNAPKEAGGDEGKLLEILAAHPRLGAKKVESVMSQMEQKAMREAGGAVAGSGVATGMDEEEKLARELAGLNELYEKTFPGMRYVVFVNGRPRPVIMENMRERIARNSFEAEKIDAINAMCDIAHDRVKKLASLANL